MDSLKNKLFGTSGVRGETNKEISPNLALELSIAFGEWLDVKGTVVLVGFGIPLKSENLGSCLNCSGSKNASMILQN